MNFKELQGHFRSLSGRHDLVDDDSTGLLKMLVNEASRALDRAITHQKSYGSHFEQLAVNAYKADMPNCRAVKEVWIHGTTGRYQLEKMDLQELIPLYLGTTPEAGEALHYAPVVTRQIPSNADLTAFASYLQYLDTTTTLDDDYTAIVIVPPTSAIVVAEIRGLFYSPRLEEDGDENYWTVMHPLTLIKETLHQLEIFNQNKTKSTLWREAVAEDLVGIGKDLVEEIISEVDQIEG